MYAIDQFASESVDAISELIRRNHYVHSLVILFSSIDTLAWTALPCGNVTRQAFCDWTERYMNPEKRLGCNALELYAARCGLVHSAAAVSNLSRKSSVRELWYVTGRDMGPLRRRAKDEGRDVAIVNVTDLVAAFGEAAREFSHRIDQDASLSNQVAERIRWWLCFVSIQSNNRGRSS